MGDRVTLARRLLKEHPGKAQELLIDYLKDSKIRTETEQYIVQHDRSPQTPDTSPQQPRPSRTHSHHPDSSLSQRTPRQNISDARHGHGLPTPSASAGSVKSHGSSLAADGRERIYLIPCEGDGTDEPVIARSAPVRYNLIGDNVVYQRRLGVNPDSVGDLVVSVPVRSGGQVWERVREAVTLTWRRRNEFRTNVTTFYLVRAGLLDSDVILDSDGSLEHQFPSGVQEAHAPHTRFPNQGIVLPVEELDPVPPPAPTVPMHSYPQTSMPPHMQQTYDRVQAFQDIQRMHAAQSSAPAPHPKSINHEQPTHPTTPLAAAGPSSGQLQVIGLWGKTPIKMLLDPDASGEAFYQAFHQWAVRRKRGGDLDRERMTLLLRANETIPEDEALDLYLSETEMESLWPSTVSWILKNKNPEAPHLYVTVELDAG